jgi:hypothetical protein
MFSRKEQKQTPKYLPESWSQEVEGLLASSYEEQLEDERKSFYVFGLTYPDEFVLMATFADVNDSSGIPVTYVASIDIGQNSDMANIVDAIVDSVGVFFDQVFSTDDWSDYQAQWEETTFKGLDFYYRSTRENVALTLEANRLLGDEEV